MAPPPLLTAATLLLLVVGTTSASFSTNYLVSTKSKQSSETQVEMKYHNGSILSSNITVHPIWYGEFTEPQKTIIRNFIHSISTNEPAPEPSVAAWWNITRLYTDKTSVNITGTVTLGAEIDDPNCSKGSNLINQTLSSVIESVIAANPIKPSPGATVYLFLTSENVTINGFCRSSCGGHGLVAPNSHGAEIPYVWVGNSAKQCPGRCAFPFSDPGIPGVKYTAKIPPNGDVGVDGMVIVAAHELADVSTNPFRNGWYAGEKTFQNEIGDLCEGIYGTGGGGAYTGEMLVDKKTNATYNANGYKEHKFLVPWLWDWYLNKCSGPNA